MTIDAHQSHNPDQPRDDHGRFARTGFTRASFNLGPMAPGFGNNPDLLSDDEYNADGSYDYPPQPRSAEQVYAFWGSVRIPDEALDFHQKAYYKDWRERGLEEAKEKYGPFPARGSQEERDEWKRKAQALANRRPSRVPAVALRTAVRLRGMWDDMRFMPENEKLRLLAMPVRVPGESKTTTVDEAISRLMPHKSENIGLAATKVSTSSSEQFEKMLTAIKESDKALYEQIEATTWEATSRSAQAVAESVGASTAALQEQINDARDEADRQARRMQFFQGVSMMRQGLKGDR